MISKEAIEEFKKIYKEKHGEELSDYVATEAATRLIDIVRAVYKPIPKSEQAEYEKMEKEIDEHQGGVKEEDKIDLVERYVVEAKISEYKTQVKKYEQDKSEEAKAVIDRAAEELAKIFILQIEESERKKKKREEA